MLAAIAPDKGWSPITKVKRDRIVLKASLQASVKKRKHQIFLLEADRLHDEEACWRQISQLKTKSEWNQEKIVALKECNNQLLKDILCEQRASNVIIDKAMIEACVLTRKALGMIREANIKCADAKEQIITKQTCATARIHAVRDLHSMEKARWQQKLGDKLNKVDEEQDALIKQIQTKSDKKFERLRCDMLPISTKIKDQRVIWQNCLVDLDSSSKNQLSKEQERRRNTVQHQLDKSSAVEDQLRELIKGL